jgi:hypothetical protein
MAPIKSRKPTQDEKRANVAEKVSDLYSFGSEDTFYMGNSPVTGFPKKQVFDLKDKENDLLTLQIHGVKVANEKEAHQYAAVYEYLIEKQSQALADGLVTELGDKVDIKIQARQQDGFKYWANERGEKLAFLENLKAIAESDKGKGLRAKTVAEKCTEKVQDARDKAVKDLKTGLTHLTYKNAEGKEIVIKTNEIPEKILTDATDRAGVMIQDLSPEVLKQGIENLRKELRNPQARLGVSGPEEVNEVNGPNLPNGIPKRNNTVTL